MNNSNVVRIDETDTLDARAKRIQSLLTNWAENSIAIGKELLAAQEAFPPRNPDVIKSQRPGWHSWCKSVGISLTAVNNLMRVARKFGDGTGGIDGLRTSQKVLVMLSQDNVPESGRREVISRIKSGENIGRGKVKQIIDSHRPKPAQANKQAEETGRAVLASDGNYYMGASKEAVKHATQRRSVVFGVRRAIETLAVLNLTPKQFLQFALPHQLWDEEEGRQIAKAAKFLDGLKDAWSER